MREVNTIAELRGTLIFSTHTNYLKVVAHLQAQGADKTLAGIASSAPARITAIDIDALCAICQVEVTILVVGDLVDSTTNLVELISSRFSPTLAPASMKPSAR